MGLLRFTLALFVVAQHLGGLRYIGSASVYVFFIISGYLMTRVMAESYSYTPDGFIRFWTNRALRLMPVYFVVLILSVPLLVHVGEDFAQAYVGGIGIPSTWTGWVQNLTMIYADLSPNTVMPRIVPPTWAITLELACYFLISIGIARSLRRAQAWLIVGAAYFVWVVFVSELPTNWGYFSVPAAFVPFAIGAVIYHQQEADSGFFPRLYGWAVSRMKAWRKIGITEEFGLVQVCLFMILAIVFVRQVITQIFHLPKLGVLIFTCNLLIGSLALMAALKWRPRASGLHRLDRLCGDMAYPVYLGHFGVGIAVAWIFSSQFDVQLGRGMALFILTAVPVTFFSFALVRLVDTPVQRVRTNVRPPVKPASPN
jgi:peptidoglycan/LPS O-acetylase OafA/YrhL